MNFEAPSKKANIDLYVYLTKAFGAHNTLTEASTNIHPSHRNNPFGTQLFAAGPSNSAPRESLAHAVVLACKSQHLRTGPSRCMATAGLQSLDFSLRFHSALTLRGLQAQHEFEIRALSTRPRRLRSSANSFNRCRPCHLSDLHAIARVCKVRWTSGSAGAVASEGSLPSFPALRISHPLDLQDLQATSSDQQADKHSEA